MKIKIHAFIIFCSLSLTSLAYSKISDPRVLKNMYDSCYAEYREGAQMSKKEFSKYCKCAADTVAIQFTTKELVLIEMDMRNLNETQKQDALLANKKMKNIVAECIGRIFK